MIQNFKIDQAATFDSIRLLSVAPKTAFGDPVAVKSNETVDLTGLAVAGWVG